MGIVVTKKVSLRVEQDVEFTSQEIANAITDADGFSKAHLLNLVVENMDVETTTSLVHSLGLECARDLATKMEDALMELRNAIVLGEKTFR